MKRLSLVVVLALLCALSLLATAGPAGAVDVTAPQWGGHEINGTLSLAGFEKKAIVFEVLADDPRVCGTMYVSIKRAWDDEDGLGRTSGTYDLYNAGGSWHCAYWEGVYSRSMEAERPWQGLIMACEARGSGDYRGLTFVMTHHQAANSPWILKGWILPAD
jgi:hypothetical protein